MSRRAGLAAAQVEEFPLDAQAAEQVTWTQFVDDGRWSLTEAGTAEGEKLLAEEMERADAPGVVESVMTEFDRGSAAITHDSMRPSTAPPAILHE